MLQKLHNLKQCSDIGRSVLLDSWFGNIKSPNFPCTKLSISEKKNSSRSLGLSYLFLTLYTNNNPHSETEFPHFPENKISWTSHDKLQCLRSPCPVEIVRTFAHGEFWDEKFPKQLQYKYLKTFSHLLLTLLHITIYHDFSWSGIWTSNLHDFSRFSIMSEIF